MQSTTFGLGWHECAEHESRAITHGMRNLLRAQACPAAAGVVVSVQVRYRDVFIQAARGVPGRIHACMRPSMEDTARRTACPTYCWSDGSDNRQRRRPTRVGCAGADQRYAGETRAAGSWKAGKGLRWRCSASGIGEAGHESSSEPMVELEVRSIVRAAERSEASSEP